jgi:ribosomal protein L7/L12
MGRELLSRKPLPKLTQPGEFTVFLQAVGEKKIEVIGEVRFLTRLGLKEAKGLVEGVPKNLKEDVAKDEVRDTLVGSSSDRRH